MNYEVEQKFCVADRAALEEQLRGLGVTLEPPVTQVDSYFAHPARDFARTDEALRIRRVGQENCVTYKGPKIDAATKTRRELEIALAAGDVGAAEFGELLDALGFRRVADVVKQRRYGHLQWEGKPAEIALDDVAGVGLYVEIELTADQSELDAARARLASLTARLKLAGSERRSYLELLLEAQASGASISANS